ncbi:MAG: chain-length determining protein [Bacteroidales bacterium]|jgi:uncharacterized protein involved in exopolysaccharide biosynthesis|nr:chain-length determining protein [Bacteroidales bacterium]
MDNQNNERENREVDLPEMMRLLWAKRLYIIKITLIAMMAGVVIAFSIPAEYTCTVKMAPEVPRSDVMGNMAGIAAITGINLGIEGTEELSYTLYPDIVRSTPFMTGLMRIPADIEGSGTGNNLYHYLDKELRFPWWEAVINAPFKLLELIRSGKQKNDGTNIDPYNLTRRGERIYARLRSRTIINVDKKTGVITAGVTLQDAVLATVVADSLVKKLERFVIDYRTTKAKQDYDFAAEMLARAKQEYYEAQNQYAKYVDRNRNIVLESVRIEQERLNNELTLAFNVYSTLAQQAESARLKVQEQTPSVTIIEPARVPAGKSNTSRIVILLVSSLTGLFLGCLVVIFSKWNRIYIVH